MTSQVWQAVERTRRERGPDPVLVSLSVAGRTELSAISLENAVAKAANVLLDPVEIEPGSMIAIELPVHWQRTVWTLAAWTVGAIVVPVMSDGNRSPSDALMSATVLITHVEGTAVARRAVHADTVGIASLHPLGLPGPHVPGTEDLSVLARLAPDGLLAPDVPADAPALLLPGVAEPWSARMCADHARARLDRPGRWLLDVARMDAVDAWVLTAWGPVLPDVSIVIGAAMTDGDSVIRSERVSWSYPAI